MAKIYAPNTQYTGVTASVPFSNGVGECFDPYLLDWFRDKGYTVEDLEVNTSEDTTETTQVEDEVQNLEELTVDELKAMAKELEIEGYSKMKKEELIQEISEAQKRE